MAGYTESPLGRITNVSWASGGVMKCYLIDGSADWFNAEYFSVDPDNGCGSQEFITVTPAEDIFVRYFLGNGPGFSPPIEILPVDDMSEVLDQAWTGATSGNTFDPTAETWSLVCEQTTTHDLLRYLSQPLYDVGHTFDIPEYYLQTFDYGTYQIILLTVNLGVGSPTDPLFQLNELVQVL